jgi:undecaprenyl-diphosphatase
MSWLYSIALGVLQGATEFLPVSSSGHLVLVPWLFILPSRDVVYYVILHWGTAIAVIAYFWRDWTAIATALLRALRSRSAIDFEVRLVGLIVLAGIPAALVGILLKDFFESMFSRPTAAAGFLVITGVMLSVTESWAQKRKEIDSMSWLDALIVGIGQAAAILPGISRSGATISAGMVRGLGRESAARFSFLLATPTIIGAGLLEIPDLIQSGQTLAQLPDLIIGFVAALASGLFCIHLLLRHLQRRTLYPFALYCSILGLTCLVIAQFRA